MKKKLFVGLVLGLFLVSFISAISTGGVNYCCEKTVDGAWCQNAPEDECNDVFRKTPTSCESTSYCRQGTCWDSEDGTCMENTPEKVCQNSGGVWSEDYIDDVPQCQLGCCLIGSQAAFVTSTKCKRLSSLYGLETDFHSSITNEVQCILSAKSDVKGACVFEQEYETTCRLLTKAECLELQETDDTVTFHEGFLCSTDRIETGCGPSKKTTCVEGEDEVYFLDSCGNLANIYDASKIDDDDYWSEIKTKSESCDPNQNNANDRNCGNCDYFLGSTCKEYKRSEDANSPKVGDNICRDLGCEYDGKRYEHGETWCADSEGTEDSLPGSRHFRMVCYNGDVTIEPCADYRQEICIESEVNGFSAAGCIVNMWQTCVAQENKKDCENVDRRDCQWVDGLNMGEAFPSNDGICIPLFSPGVDFWNTEGDVEQMCSVGTAVCTVTCEKKLGGSKKCSSDLGCVDSSGKVLDSWEDKMNMVCNALGDCGADVNYIGVEGFQNESTITKSSAGGDD